MLRGIIFAMTSAFFVYWRHRFHKLHRKRNAHKFWTTCAIKTIDPSLGRYLIVDFKNRQFVDLRAYNFVDVTFLKYKISTMWPRWLRHRTMGSYETKIFLLKYFWIGFRKCDKVSAQAEGSFKTMSVLFNEPPSQTLLGLKERMIHIINDVK